MTGVCAASDEGARIELGSGTLTRAGGASSPEGRGYLRRRGLTTWVRLRRRRWLRCLLRGVIFSRR